MAEQSFQFDLVSQARLLQRYLGQRITVEQPRGDTVDLLQGKLVGIGDGLTLPGPDGPDYAREHLQFSLQFIMES